MPIQFDPGQPLVPQVAAIPSTETEVDLDEYFAFENVENILAVLAVIPGTVLSLSLRASRLGARNEIELATIFAHIPPTVKSLDISYNFLFNNMKRTVAELGCIFTAIPATVRTLTLNGNGNYADLSAFVDVLVATDKNIIINDESITKLLPERKKQLQQQRRIAFLAGLRPQPIQPVPVVAESPHSEQGQKKQQEDTHCAFFNVFKKKDDKVIVNQALADKNTIGIVFDFLG